MLAGKTYEVSVNCTTFDGTGGLKALLGSGTLFVSNSGITTGVFTVTSDTPVSFIRNATDVDLTLSSVSVREVNQVMNNNKQHYFCPLLGLLVYKTPRDIAEHLDVVEFMYNHCEQLYEALYDEVSGEIVYDEVSLQILYDEEA